MLNEKLFEEVLIKPVLDGCNKLRIVSGYASSAMAFHHLEKAKKINKISIELLIGMCSQDGISLSNHRGFQHLTKIEYPEFFRCSYLVKNPPVHSKAYVWMNNEKLFKAYVGSANYTQNAFLMGQRESVCECDPVLVSNYFSDLESATIYCDHIDAEEFIQIYNDKAYAKRKTQDVEEKPGQDPMFAKSKILGLDHLKVSLLARGGNIGSRSGLNWGQRPEERREPNQAYIPLKAGISRSDFFPPRNIKFTVLTDDHKTIICSRTQDNGKAILTPQNNSILGEYFRKRIGVPLGKFVHKEDLVKYGRTDIEFFKIDSETYYMDFSV